MSKVRLQSAKFNPIAKGKLEPTNQETLEFTRLFRKRVLKNTKLSPIRMIKLASKSKPSHEAYSAYVGLSQDQLEIDRTK